ncbi:hypothetical protein [Promicromonospora iranensis]|uniref:Uncharacterized protein n=1 Tax=Promicromonospora iranensis TaxID=1105144 RepID=A0ABU2CRB6_9MICO|nr:hypothetical protein [Promicromonospora iranensis]MDR7383884.1 hypothetical protein [Promicromonospora iranensis]
MTRRRAGDLDHAVPARRRAHRCRLPERRARAALHSRNEQLNYRQLALYVDENDAEAISAGLLDVLAPYFEPAPGKSRTTLSLISVPDV